MDAFFASVEQLDFPEMRGKPVIVGGTGGRGVVATASYEARKYGVHSAMPIARARNLCPKGIYVHPRFSRYKELAEIIFSIYHTQSDLVEPLSLDEAYLDVTENLSNEPSATRLAVQIKNEILQKTGLTASAGVSFNKFFAKIASGMNKPNGLTVLKPDTWEKIILELPIEKFHGIGKVTAARLKNAGIHYGQDIHNQSLSMLQKLLGKSGIYYYNIVRGIDDRPVIPERERKSLGAENTFLVDLLSPEEVLAELKTIVDVLGIRINKTMVKGRTVTLKVKYDDFQTVTRSISLPYYVNDKNKILVLAIDLLKNTEIGKRKIRLIGVSISNLDDKNNKDSQENTLFD